MPPVLEALGIVKTYPGGVVANAGVDLAIEPGAVHAVVGENGAGKSTLMKVLFGLEQPDAGEIRLNSRPVRFSGPGQAIAAGVGMVFQHFSLVPSFTVYENVVLGSEPRSGVAFDRREAIAQVRTLSREFRLSVDPLASVASLPVGQQQRVEILKALYRRARVLILDEPTAVLAPQEVRELFAAVRALARQGRTVIFIAHKLPEVIEISDAITVLRYGRTVWHGRTRDVSERQLATLMVGREIPLRADRTAAEAGEVCCRVEGLGVVDERGVTLCADIDIDARRGEIIGLVGVEGNGQAELLEALAGLRPAAAGTITVEGRNITTLSVKARRAHGVASIPEDRLSRGLAAGATLAENLVATRLGDRRFVRHGLLDFASIHRMASELIERFTIRSRGPGTVVSTLSGGNMQKIVIARELAERPVLLLVNQPTRGVDLQATQFIWRAIMRARDEGAAVLLSSADLSEVLALADRVVVFFGGRIVAAFRNSDALTSETLGVHMLGLAPQGGSGMDDGPR